MTDDTPLENVKKVITGILVSMADEPFITVQKLCQKYREFEGTSIPFYKLGFNRIEDFLHSLPDILKVKNSHRNGLIVEYTNSSKNSQHIAELVSQQKKPKSRQRPMSSYRSTSSSMPSRFVRDREQNNKFSQPNNSSSSQYHSSTQNAQNFLRSPQQQYIPNNFSPANQQPLVPQYPVQQYGGFLPPTYPHQNFHANSAHLFNLYHYQNAVNQHYAQMNQMGRQQIPQQYIGQQMHYNNNNNFPNVNDIAHRLGNMQLNQQLSTKIGQQLFFQPNPQPLLPTQQQQQQRQNNNFSATNVQSSDKNYFATHQRSSSNNHLDASERATNLPNKNSEQNTSNHQSVTVDTSTINNIKESENVPPKNDYSFDVVTERILEQSEIISDGIYSDSDSIPSLNKSIIDQCDVISNTSLVDESAVPVAGQCTNGESDRISLNQLIDQCEALTISDDSCSEAIPDLADNDPIFLVNVPEDCVGFGAVILPASLPDYVKVEGVFKVYVSEIHNPYKFWFHFYSEASKLDKLMSEIDFIYSKFEKCELQIHPVDFVEGLLCVALYDGVWHRAEVLSKEENDMIKLLFIDYGTVCKININEIKYMVKKLTELPSQAFRGTLDYIRPIGVRWSRDASYSFLAWVNNELLYAKATEINVEERHVHMILINTNGPKDVQVNELFIDRGYAKFYNPFESSDSESESNVIATKRHFQESFPTFQLLESGSFPSFSDIGVLILNGFDFDVLQDELFIPYELEIKHQQQQLSMKKKLLAVKNNDIISNPNEENKLHKKELVVPSPSSSSSTSTTFEHKNIKLKDEENKNISQSISSSSCSALNPFKKSSYNKVNQLNTKQSPNYYNTANNNISNNDNDVITSPTKPPPGFKQKIFN